MANICTNNILVEGQTEHLVLFLMEEFIHQKDISGNSIYDRNDELKLFTDWDGDYGSVDPYTINIRKNRYGLVNGIMIYCDSKWSRLPNFHLIAKEYPHLSFIVEAIEAGNGVYSLDQFVNGEESDINVNQTEVISGGRLSNHKKLQPGRPPAMVDRNPLVGLMRRYEDDGAALEFLEKQKNHRFIKKQPGAIWTPLQWSAYMGHHDISMKLIDMGENPMENSFQNSDITLDYLGDGALAMAAHNAINFDDITPFEEMLKRTTLYHAGMAKFKHLTRLFIQEDIDFNLTRMYLSHIHELCDMHGLDVVYELETQVHYNERTYFEKVIRQFVADSAMSSFIADGTSARKSTRI